MLAVLVHHQQVPASRILRRAMQSVGGELTAIDVSFSEIHAPPKLLHDANELMMAFRVVRDVAEVVRNHSVRRSQQHEPLLDRGDTSLKQFAHGNTLNNHRNTLGLADGACVDFPSFGIGDPDVLQGICRKSLLLVSAGAQS